MRLFRLALCFGLIPLFGCVAHSEDSTANPVPVRPDQKDEPEVAAKRVKLGKHLFLEVQGDKRRVLLEAQVCLRQGILEQLLTKTGTKEHEAILAADIDAREIHAALILAGAEAGKTVSYNPKFTPPTGTTVKIFVEYEEKGKKIRVPAQQWIRNIKSKKDLHTDWVFAGSYLDPNQLDKTKKPRYAANIGDVICISNFDSAMLDVPFDSPKDNDDLSFEANTARIPAEKTPVLVILEPVLAKKK